MKQNGTILAHGTEWPLYERQVYPITVLEMTPEDQAARELLDEQSAILIFPWGN